VIEIEMNGMNPLGINSVQSSLNYDFTASNMVLMIGGQILLILVGLFIVFFGSSVTSFPANSVRKMLHQRTSS
jgi:hypothetical protein